MEIILLTKSSSADTGALLKNLSILSSVARCQVMTFFEPMDKLCYIFRNFCKKSWGFFAVWADACLYVQKNVLATLNSYYLIKKKLDQQEQ